MQETVEIIDNKRPKGPRPEEQSRTQRFDVLETKIALLEGNFRDLKSATSEELEGLLKTLEDLHDMVKILKQAYSIHERELSYDCKMLRKELNLLDKRHENLLFNFKLGTTCFSLYLVIKLVINLIIK